MRLEWGPFIEMSCILEKTASNRILEKLIKLSDQWYYFYDTWIPQRWEGTTYIKGGVLNDRKFFDLDIYDISPELTCVHFNFIYHTWINGESYGVDDWYISEKLQKVLSLLKSNLNFKYWSIDNEDDILKYFNTEECWPHSDYVLSNFDLLRFNSDNRSYYKI